MVDAVKKNNNQHTCTPARCLHFKTVPLCVGHKLDREINARRLEATSSLSQKRRTGSGAA
jgi:hypothetical protein